ncbi:SGNH/GDSL hydrolase family protein [Haloglycomyces albus]|uniref:SGNH/GDSL hydrolase family protein n=1 Tax=Haloglycomyces albus TaxID=526067 RepID=UPI00046CF1E9|nr:SGNH/GDSL hydrolase family protein [Haloglycomyces albus]
MTGKYSSYVAIGDSFTEGVGDPSPQGSRPRGWADLFATAAAEENTEFTYANLAIRGRLFDAVVDEQVPPAMRQNPELVSFAAGGNDALRPSFQPDRLASRAHEVVRLFKAAGAEVILFTSADVGRHLPGMTLMRKRFVGMNDIIRKVARRHDAILIDLWREEAFQDGTFWAEDRLHLSTKGHMFVASKVCEALDVKPDLEWEGATVHDTTTSMDVSKAQWARKHLGPWIKRRLTGKSSGDTVQPKRPELKPVTRN